MKNVLMIKKKNNDKIVNYKDIKKENYYLNINLDKIIKELFELEKTIVIEENKNNEYNVYLENNLLCNLTIINEYTKCKCIIKIAKNDMLCRYDVIEKEDNLILMLSSCNFLKNEVSYNIVRFHYKYIVDIKNNNRGIHLVLGDILEKSKDIVNLIYNIKLNDSIEEIYNHIINEIKVFYELTIRKYNILNTVDSKEINTDLIIIKNGRLIDYLTNIEKRGKKYVIKKDRDNYSITLLNSSIDGFISTYFDINDQVKFVKKLEKTD